MVGAAGEVRGYRAVPADSRESRQTAVEADQKIINELQQRKVRGCEGGRGQGHIEEGVLSKGRDGGCV